MQASRQRLFGLVQQTVRKYHHGDFKTPSMNELPIPAGSWQAQYDRNQKKYNAVLVMGIGFLALSVAVAKQSGLVYFNWSPPKTLD